jgi:hypothetical protein
MKLERVLVLEYESSPVADPEITVIIQRQIPFIWSSEGARVIAAEDKEVLQNPSLNFMDLKGTFLSTATLPENLKCSNKKRSEKQRNIRRITFDKKGINLSIPTLKNHFCFKTKPTIV